jgi:hypothetical protein
MKPLVRALLVTVAALAAFTWWSLESSGVATIETRRPNGLMRKTHVWYVEAGGDLWVEAGTPENAWYVDIQREPSVVFEGGGHAGRYEAQPVPGEVTHHRIRSLLREKYGIRDWWIGLIFDTSDGVAVQLVPEDTRPR